MVRSIADQARSIFLLEAQFNLELHGESVGVSKVSALTLDYEAARQLDGMREQIGKVCPRLQLAMFPHGSPVGEISFCLFATDDLVRAVRALTFVSWASDSPQVVQFIRKISLAALAELSTRTKESPL